MKELNYFLLADLAAYVKSNGCVEIPKIDQSVLSVLAVLGSFAFAPNGVFPLNAYQSCLQR